jgi:hypothetical protein
MGHDDDRGAILRRRRFFIATAMAGLAATQCDNKPKVCLNISVVEDGGTTQPTVCLSPQVIPPDAQTPVAPTTPEAGAEAATDAGLDAGAKHVPPMPTRPHVCLSPVRPPKPAGG